jgi:hypothetical protein
MVNILDLMHLARLILKKKMLGKHVKKMKNKGYHCKQMRGGRCNCEEKLGTHSERKSGFKGLSV